jgi:hypothetical protein
MEPAIGVIRHDSRRMRGRDPNETYRAATPLELLFIQAGVIVSDYTTLMVEILKDNARPEAGEVYGAMDVAWAKLVGQIAQVYGK